MTTTCLALDCEFLWDAELHRLHKSMDPKSNRHSASVKKVMAASVFEITFDDEGRVSCGSLASWNEHTCGDEGQIVRQLFYFLRAREQCPVLTYGGLATDIPILLLAAMRHGIAMPPQLEDQPGRRGPRPHLDLALLLKGGGRTWFHLAQVALRLGVPIQLISAKADVPRPCQPEAWRRLSNHCELDTLVLSLAWTAWLVTQGKPGVRYPPAAIALIAGFLRRRPDHVMAEVLAGYSRSLAERMEAAFAEAA